MEKDKGKITSQYSGVCKVEGLKGVFMHEVLVDKEGKEVGMVVGFDDKLSEVILFNDKVDGEEILRSGKVFGVSVGVKYLGRVVDGLGRPLDGLAEISGDRRSVFGKAPAIIERQPVDEPLTTGIKIIDSTLPLGRGQRELLVGDRKLGKTTIALDIVLNQADAAKKVVCVYVICGKKRNELREIVKLLSKNGAFLYTIVVAATSNTPLANQYLAPFVGVSLAEYFRDMGKDTLVIYDDLSKHAKVYRDISLLLERAPGREAYPGDIFTLHSKLLERAGKLNDAKGGGSITAIPIIETQEGDITSFIPTNLISITDGQLYVERGLFQKGFLPAINIGLSVSRVGSEAQQTNLKKVTGGIRLTLSQQNELQKLTQLETVLSKEARKNIFRGELTLALLKQDKHTFVDWREQTVLFFALENGFFDGLTEANSNIVGELFLVFLRNRYSGFLKEVEDHDIEDLGSRIKGIVEDFFEGFIENESND